MIYKLLTLLSLFVFGITKAQQNKTSRTNTNSKVNENKVILFNPSETDKNETIDWLTVKTNTFGLPLTEAYKCTFFGESISEFSSGNYKWEYKAIFSDATDKPTFKIDTSEWSLVIEWNSYLKCEKVVYWEYEDETTKQTKSYSFQNVVNIPISNIKEIERKTHLTGGYEYMSIFNYDKSIENVLQEIEKGQTATYKRDSRFDGFQGDRYLTHYLVFKTDLRIISSRINGKPETKEWRIEIPFNFNEDYDLVNRIEKALTHLKEYYTKKRPQEKF